MNSSKVNNPFTNGRSEGMAMLHRFDHIPDGLLDCTATSLADVIPDTALIELAGARDTPLFLSVLLHGNEPTGLAVAQNILRKYADTGLPRSLVLFIGNVKAAAEGKRRLDGQPDYNRIWLEGRIDKESAIHLEIAALLHEMARRPLFASIDIHNNTGINPHYACVNRLDNRFLNLARRFSRKVIYFVRPSGVQSMAFSHLCPAVTLECGKVGDEIGIQLATAFVDDILNSEAIPEVVVADDDLDLFHTLAVVRVPEHVAISFDGSEADVRFIQGIESLNFEEIPPGTTLARIRDGVTDPIVVMNEDGETITSEIFRVKDGCLVNNKALMPSMLTLDEKVIRQDCLCYVMERYRIAMGEKFTSDDRPIWAPDET